MKTLWDYTTLADAYLERPDYADAAIDAFLRIAGVKPGDKICDIGAGVAHLTLMLARRGYDVMAVEPNDAMRRNGIKRTASFGNVSWHEGTGEHSGQADQSFRLVTFGSSFNVCDRLAALSETVRILQPGGWFACMWNHRDLTEPVQAMIEEIIKSRVPEYGYGSRRENQRDIIESSGKFGTVVQLSARVTHEQSIDACVEAWRSHATLERQARDKFSAIISDIKGYLDSLKVSTIKIPYTTNVWIAQAQ